MSEEDDDHDLFLKAGAEISSTKNVYVVEEIIGQGGFGSVYKVKDKATGVNYAMKTEKIMENKQSKLKMEILILKLVANERKTSHFTQISDRGKKDREGFVFLVMELAGPSLSDLKKKRETKLFSPPTGLSVSKQCLEACEDLHKYGFIHRDIKPANYACGREKKHIIYILDFGIARKILNDRNELKTPRVSVRFKGTVKFASLACHKGTEMGWKDDCESWFYMVLDLTAPNGVPWKTQSEKEVIMKLKEESRSKKETMFSGLKCPSELGKVLDYIDKLKYQDHPDYQYIYRLLEEGCISCGGRMDAPYDWETEK